MSPISSNISKILNLPESQDYDFLRKKGIEYIQQFSGKIWTDYNIHDPGVTILEILCYAITDLGFRASYPIEDILAAKPGEDDISGKSFFTAEKILPTAPLTINDYRKLLIDIKGVANAWLDKAETNEITLFADLKDSELRNYSTVYNDVAERTVTLNGLYDVFIELETPYIDKKDEVLSNVKLKLNKNRNLCEDFINITALDFEKIAINADIEVILNVDVESILAEIFYRVDRFISHPIRFYSLKEMLDKNTPVSSIYEGPCLDHGFIDDNDLEKSTRKFGDDNIIYTSDIINVIMDIPEVIAVENLWVSNYINNRLVSCDNHKIKLSNNHARKFYKEKSNLTCSNGSNYYRINNDLIDIIYNELKASSLDARELVEKRNEESEIEIPHGQYRNLADYKSIQENFPLSYHVGYEGVSADQPELLKAQVKQLKAFLLFFDQLLANYLSQLENVKRLYSFDPQTETFFINQNLDKIPFVSDLIADQVTYLKELKRITDDKTNFETRRNKFLDHLLSRFSEDFTEYSLLMYRLKANNGYAQHLIEAKSGFLSEYDAISTNRNRAFNYLLCGNTSSEMLETWNTENVSGFERKICRSLGMIDFTRRSLSNGGNSSFSYSGSYGSQDGIGADLLNVLSFNEGIHVVENILLRPKHYCDAFLPICLHNPNIIKLDPCCKSDKTDRFELYKDHSGKWRFRLKNGCDQIILKSQQGFETREVCLNEINRIKNFGKVDAAYSYHVSHKGRFYFNIVTDENEVLCTGNFYKEEDERDKIKASLIELFNRTGGCHEQDYSEIDPASFDPYSFSITVVLPSWTGRCQSNNFRNYVEQLLSKEAPSYVQLNIYWLDYDQMVKFEESYKNWLKSINQPENEGKCQIKNKFIEVLKQLRNVYPVNINSDEHNLIYPTTVLFDENDNESYPSVNDSTLDAL